MNNVVQHFAQSDTLSKLYIDTLRAELNYSLKH